jgi:hypothetical protein
MRKLALDLGALQVESFETHARPLHRGTVNGHVGGFSKYPCESIDIGCISDPTRCGGCEESQLELCVDPSKYPCESIDIGCISDPTGCFGCQVTSFGCD